VLEYDLRFRTPEPAVPPPPRRRAADMKPRALALAGVALAAAAVIGVSAWLVAGSGSSSKHPPAAVAKTPPPRRPHRHVTPPTAAAPAGALVIKGTRGNCWLMVRVGSTSGPIVYQRTLQQGQTVRFGLRRPLWIRIGAPWNIDAAIGDRSFSNALPAQTGDVLVTNAGLQPAA
jgi:hypothetical protein